MRVQKSGCALTRFHVLLWAYNYHYNKACLDLHLESIRTRIHTFDRYQATEANPERWSTCVDSNY